MPFRKERFKLHNNKKIVALSLVFILMIILVASGLFFYRIIVKTELEHSTLLTLSEIADQQAYNFKSKIAGETETIKTIAKNISNLESSDKEIILNIISSVVPETSFEKISIASREGEAISSDGEIFNVSKREYFQRAIKGETVLSEPFISSTRNAEIVVLATPIIKDGEAVSVVIGSYVSSKLDELFASTSFGESGYAYLLNQKGDIIAKSLSKYSITSLNNVLNVLERSEVTSFDSLETVKKNMQNLESGFCRYNFNGQVRLARYVPIGYNNWYLYSAIPEDVIAKQSNKISTITNAMTIIVALSFLIFMLYIVKFQRDHINEISIFAFNDTLTGARNTIKFNMDAALSLQIPNSKWAFLIFDVDKMKMFNETFGFVSGDFLILYIAKTFARFLDADEPFGRIGTDEFCALIHYENDKAVNERMEQMFKHINDEFVLRHPDSYSLTFSVGVYIVEDNHEALGSISDKARYVHRIFKHTNENNVSFYNENVRKKVAAQKEIENRMVEALRTDQFLLYLQPKYSTKEEVIVGAEALVRWQTPEGKFIFPNEFIPLFEQNGFITKLDMYMFNKACKVIKQWIDEGIEPVTISVNFSRLHLKNKNFIYELSKIINENKILPKYLEIELTESTMLDNEETLLSVMTELHKLGFTVSMDDFGSGYSSLGLLKSIPVDVIKLDRTFFACYKEIERAKTVVSSVIGLAKSLKIYTVAEGVETIEHIELLRELECDIIQGYYFAKPMPHNELTLMLEKLKNEFNKEGK